MPIDFDNTYIDLPERFYAKCEPVPVDDPQIIRVNDGLAQRLSIDSDWLGSDEGVRFAVGNRVLEGSEPIATAYAGDQFGSFVPQLGEVTCGSPDTGTGSKAPRRSLAGLDGLTGSMWRSPSETTAIVR